VARSHEATAHDAGLVASFDATRCVRIRASEADDAVASSEDIGQLLYASRTLLPYFSAAVRQMSNFQPSGVGVAPMVSQHERTAMATVGVRYIVNDVDEAITF
jgi:hypothetical protein